MIPLLLRRRSDVSRRLFGGLISVIATTLVALPAHVAWSQTKQIKIVVPVPPGGAGDMLARLLAEQVAQAHEAGLVIENRPGAGTVIGTEAVARAAPDGSTLLMVANSFVVNPAFKKGNYDVSTS